MNKKYTETIYEKNSACTTYGTDAGCGGCRVNDKEVCKFCIDKKTGELKNFQPAHDYWQRR